MKSLGIIISAVLLAASAHALSVDGPMEVMQSIESPSSDFWDDPGYTTSPDFIIAPQLHYLSEVVQTWRDDGFGMVAFNDSGLQESGVTAYFSADYGQTWQSQEKVWKSIRGGDVFDWASDPQATTYLDSRGRTRFALGAVGLTRAFNSDGFRNCEAPGSAMVVATTNDSVHWSRLHHVPSPPGDAVLEDRPMLVGDGSDLWAMYNAVANDPDSNLLGCEDETALLWFTRSSDGGASWTPPVQMRTRWSYDDGQHTGMAPQNIIVDHGKLLFAFFSADTNLKVYRCAVDGLCTILKQGGVGFHPAPSDHFHVAGLPSTRVNSMPTIACDDARTRCIVAWMDADPATPEQGRIAVISTPNAQDPAEPSGMWTYPPQPMPLGATQGSQILPAASWGQHNPMVCWYQQLGVFPDPLSGSLDYVCTSSTDGGVTWRPVQIIGHVDIGNATSIGTNFLGDYNQCDGKRRKCVWTGNLWETPWPLPPGHWRKRPIVEMGAFNPDSSCAVGPGGGSGAWMLIAPLVWLVPRLKRVRWWAVILGTAMIIWAIYPAVTRATCLGDCNADGAVRIDECVTMVNIALGDMPVDACPVAAQCDDTGLGVYVPCLVEAVGAALGGCPVEAME